MRRGSECIQGVQGTGRDAVSVCRSKESWLPGPHLGIAGTGRHWHPQVNAVRAGVVMGVCTTGVEPKRLHRAGKAIGVLSRSRVGVRLIIEMKSQQNA